MPQFVHFRENDDDQLLIDFILGKKFLSDKLFKAVYLLLGDILGQIDLLRANIFQTLFSSLWKIGFIW